ncbi:hypothetical protein [Microbacterium aquimaris]|uniref:Uncharacterized protein n=1 Tax=Microbacterium aquimaris TaxID=459816 RepID=A0ABU5N7D8_9MICO|nr:hypothetical protein [Microbacterium aquimaris]MDZ8161993.1 hypothetical protein [Microbacterium aquimaris]
MANAQQTAGALIFGTADRDMKQIAAAIRDYPREGNLALMLALAETAALALEQLHGDDWRQALSVAMLDAELDDIDPTGTT